MFQQNVTFGPGTGTFTQHTFEIIIMLLGALLIGLWLGWVIWGKYKQMIEKIALDNQSLSATADTLRAELAAAKGQLATADSNFANLSAEVSQLTLTNRQLQDKNQEMEAALQSTQARNRVVETELGLSSSPADDQVAHRDIPLEIEHEHTVVPEEVVTPDDVVNHLADDFHLDLAGMSPTETDVNDEAFTIVPENPLPEPQPEDKPTTLPPATEMVLPVSEMPAAAAGTRDDLTVIEGIGPKIQELLYQYGILSYAELAATDVARLREILSSAGPQLAMHDPGTWPSQANLAANDEWDNLKAIQKFLKGGKKPT